MAVSRRMDDADDVVEALDRYIAARFGIVPRYSAYMTDQHAREFEARELLQRALAKATGNPEPE